MNVLIRKNIKGEEVTIKDRYIRAKEVVKLCGNSRPSIYKMMAAFKFPPSHSISECSVGWLESDIEEYMKLGPIGFFTKYGKQLADAKNKLAA